MSSKDNTINASSSNVGMWIFFAFFAIVLGLTGTGTIIELTSIGDEDDYKGGEAAESLYYASLFRRLY
jgi:hypothetical protein